MQISSQNRSKKPLKIIPKSIQNRPKIHQKASKNRSWSGSPFLWRFWPSIRRSWGRLGLPKWSQNCPKIHSKINHFFNGFLDRFWLPFASLFGLQNPLKSVKNRCRHAVHLGVYFLMYFGSVFAPNFDPLDLKKPCFSLGKTWFFEKSPFKVNIAFWSHFGVNFAPFWHPKSTKIHPKIDPERHQKNDWFFNQCLMDLGANMGGKMETKTI